MPIFTQLVAALAATAALLPAARAAPGAAPLIPRIFAPEAVLPAAPNLARVWGWSAPGDVVNATVACAGKAYHGSGSAGADGLWVLTLPSIDAVFGCSLALNAANWSASVVPVHFGTVLFCGGQSNAHLPLDYSVNGTQEAANAASYKNIRLLQQDTVSQASMPLPDALAIVQSWTAPTPAIASGFSAICWWTGRYLSDALRMSIPIGLVQGAWPSTYIRQLGPAEIGETCGVTGVDAATGARDPCSGDSCKIFNSFMAPFQPGPFEFAALVWLQGETDRNNPRFYNCALPAFINALRSRFNPLMYVAVIQLAPWVAEGGLDVALLREAQSNASLAMERVGLAVSVDLGDPQAPAGSIHSRLKAPAGQRAAWLLLAGLFGNSTFSTYVSPRYAGASGGAQGATLKATINFAPGSTAGGLQAIAGAHCPVELGVPAGECSGFAIGATDGVLYNASAAVGAGGDTLELTAIAKSSGLRVLVSFDANQTCAPLQPRPPQKKTLTPYPLTNRTRPLATLTIPWHSSRTAWGCPWRPGRHSLCWPRCGGGRGGQREHFFYL
jgi:sialate O-acetylesterase